MPVYLVAQLNIHDRTGGQVAHLGWQDDEAVGLAHRRKNS
jgi:hypothetical protein